MRVVVGAWAWLQKSALTPVQQQAIQHSLTIKPRKVGDHPGDVPAPIHLFVDERDVLGVPREYFLMNKKENHEVIYNLCEGDKTTWPGDLAFAGQLRPSQEEAVSQTLQRLRGGRLGGVIKMVTGSGKTVTACNLISRLNIPTLVVVHKKFLLDQWEERIAQFLPGALIGRAQQDVCDYKGKHVVIGMVHSLASHEYPREFFEWPGLVLVDEVHRIGAATWAPVPARFAARYRIGLSATPRRKDGAENVFRYHIGDVLYASEERRMIPKIRRVYTDFRLARMENFNPNLAPKSLKLKFLCGADPRNRLIRERLVMALKAGRKVLVLSERLQHLRALETDLRKHWEGKILPTTGFYIGGQSEDALDAAAEAQCIFATYQFASEGLDIPALDTLFLATPIADAEQSVGRILRPFEGKKDPIVVDFRDDLVGQFKKYGEIRDALYNKICA